MGSHVAPMSHTSPLKRESYPAILLPPPPSRRHSSPRNVLGPKFLKVVKALGAIVALRVHIDLALHEGRERRALDAQRASIRRERR